MRKIQNTTTDFYRSFDNTKIYYEIQGSLKNKKVMVFLHGLGGNLSPWDSYRRYFSKLGYTTIAVDLRGHGLSDKPKLENAYILENFSRDIQTLLKLLKIKDAILVGHCFGGMVAIITAALFSPCTKNLILIGTNYKSSSLSPFSKKSKTLSFLYYIASKSPISLSKKGYPDISKFIGTGDFCARRIITDILYTTLLSYIGTFNGICSFNGSGYLKNILCPTLIIQGAKDSIFPINTGLFLKDSIKNSELVFVPKANHMLVINNAEEIQIIIKNYLHNNSV